MYAVYTAEQLLNFTKDDAKCERTRISLSDYHLKINVTHTGTKIPPQLALSHKINSIYISHLAYAAKPRKTMYPSAVRILGVSRRTAVETDSKSEATSRRKDAGPAHSRSAEQTVPWTPRPVS